MSPLGLLKMFAGSKMALALWGGWDKGDMDEILGQPADQRVVLTRVWARNNGEWVEGGQSTALQKNNIRASWRYISCIQFTFY